MGWDDITCCPLGPRPLAPPAKPGAVSQSWSLDCIMNINKAQRSEIPGLPRATPQAPPTHPPHYRVRPCVAPAACSRFRPRCSDSDSEPGKGAVARRADSGSDRSKPVPAGSAWRGGWGFARDRLRPVSPPPLGHPGFPATAKA